MEWLFPLFISLPSLFSSDSVLTFYLVFDLKSQDHDCDA